MTSIPLHHVDAFALELFRGNPAAVCPLETWLDDALLQSIATENNLSETAFFVPEGDRYRLRWFTPVREVPLCGHATLAAASVIFRDLPPSRDHIAFDTLSGPLHVSRRGDLLTLDFPVRPPVPCATPPELLAGLGLPPLEVHTVDLALDLANLGKRLVIVKIPLELKPKSGPGKVKWIIEIVVGGYPTHLGGKAGLKKAARTGARDTQ